MLGGLLGRGEPERRVGLVLPGGGARSAYQVGVLQAIAEIWPEEEGNPFPVISGTSAGAINASALASGAQDFHGTVERLSRVWAGFHAAQVYRTDGWHLTRTALRWLGAILFGGLGAGNPRSLLDNTPLRRLLEREVHLEGVQASIEAGVLDALAITASNYASARSVTFFQGREEFRPWQRTRREGRREEIRHDHLMASAAIPLVFPAVELGRDYYGDGSMRQAAPLSPAIHLGAERLLVIGVRNEDPPKGFSVRGRARYPSIAQIAGYMLDTLFMDSLYSDLERLTRLNQLVEQLPKSRFRTRSHELKKIEALVMLPSADVLELATEHLKSLPRSVRALLSGVGGLNVRGRPLISYLLFESGFCEALMELGHHDAMAHKERIVAFLRGEPTDTLSAPDQVRELLGNEESGPETEQREEADDVGDGG